MFCIRTTLLVQTFHTHVSVRPRLSYQLTELFRRGIRIRFNNLERLALFSHFLRFIISVARLAKAAASGIVNSMW